MDIAGGAAIVTGAGMGAVTARRFAELGCNVVKSLSRICPRTSPGTNLSTKSSPGGRSR